MTFFLGIDMGTQSVKTLVFDASSRNVMAVASAPLELISSPDGTREQHAEWWIAGLKQCLAQIDSDIRQAVVAVGVSGQQHGFVPLAADGAVLAPVKLWCDTATTSECRDIMAAFGGEERCLREVGNSVLPGYTASKILWLKRNHRDLYERMATILLPHDYLNFYLTGERVMECGDASGTGLLDIRSRTWHQDMLAAVDNERDLSTCLPQLAKANTFIGEVRSEIAVELGLPAGIPVSCGGGDNMMAAIGTGNVAAGRMTVSLGTSGTLFAYCDKPVLDEQGMLAAFCDSTGGWLPLLCTMNCTVATELTRAMLNIPLDELESRVERAPVGSAGVMTLPFFQGERTPNLPNGRGCILGLNNTNYSAENLLRSAMESAVYGLRTGLDAFRRQGCEISSIRLTGGGARSAVWRQMVADVFGLPVTVQQLDEGAALGAALQALWVYGQANGSGQPLAELLDDLLDIDADRCCEPEPTNVSAYADHYRQYLAHLNAITPLYLQN